MAPGTNIGAAHPVDMQGKSDAVLNEKIVNDAAAFIRTIAEKRNRNVQWAEDAVSRSVSITESEAVKNKIVELVAINEHDLLMQIDGKVVELAGGNKTLHTANAKVKRVEMGFTEKMLPPFETRKSAHCSR